MKSLSETFPDIAAQWDYELNGDLTPDSVSYGSNLKVWWKCPVCGHSYPKKISNRTSPRKGCRNFTHGNSRQILCYE